MVRVAGCGVRGAQCGAEVAGCGVQGMGYGAQVAGCKVQGEGGLEVRKLRRMECAGAGMALG